MKTIISLISILFLTVSLFAQPADNPNYLVKFTDKNNSPFSVNNPEEFLSQRAIDRRTRQNIAIDETDLPVNPNYVQAVIDAGAAVKNKLKWFNAVTAKVPNNAVLQDIENLSFVLEVILVSSENVKNKFKKPFFANEFYNKLNPYASYQQKSTDDLNYGQSYNQINQLNGIPLHNDGFQGQGMLIAVIDAGFDDVHIISVFDSLFANNQIKGTYNFVEPGASVYTEAFNGHGTSVLSTMGGYAEGELIGTAPKADYWLLRTEDGSDEYLMEEYYWAAAAEFADSLGADIFNTSLGYTEFNDSQFNHTYNEMDGNTTPITIAADMAASKGILAVNSNGNEGSSSWYYMGAPADADNILSIGSVYADGTSSEFSSHGPTFDGRLKPNLCAQGSEAVIYSADWNAITVGYGTSFSSPIMAGIVACFWQSNPDATNMEIINALERSASHFQNPDENFGYGIPDFVLAQETLEIDEKNVDNQLNIAPNPFSNVFKISFNDTMRRNLEIYNLLGQKVFAKIINSKEETIDELGNFDTGIYFITVRSGNNTFSTKIIKN